MHKFGLKMMQSIISKNGGCMTDVSLNEPRGNHQVGEWPSIVKEKKKS